MMDTFPIFQRGLDDRPIRGTNEVRKSLGAEVNWGIRFEKLEEVEV